MLLFLETENNFLENFVVCAIKFPTICVFQPCRSKTVGEDTFPAAKSVTFQEKGKTHKYQLYV